MAVKDVKNYYFTMLAQYTEMKQDLADFEQALKDGHITEDQLEAAKDEVAIIETNFNRLSYIMFLLEAPQRDSKKPKYNKQNSNIANELKNRSADLDTVTAENKSALDSLRKELKQLIKEK